MALAGYKGSVYGQTGVSATFTNLPCTDSGAIPARTSYRINDTTKRFWDDATVVTVQTSPDGTTWTTQSATLYTVQYPGGYIVFNSAQASGTQVRVSGKAYPMAAFAEFKDWSLDLDVAPLDSTAFVTGANAGWKTFIGGLKSGSITCSAWADSTYFMGYITTPTRIAISLYIDALTPGAHWDLWSNIVKDALKVSSPGLNDHTRTLQVTGQAYLNAT